MKAESDSLLQDILKSLLLHVGILASVFFVSWAMEKFFMLSSQKLIQIRSAIRVDLVDMPEYTLKELQNMSVTSPDNPGKAEQAPSKDIKGETDPARLEFKMLEKKSALKDLLAKFSKKEIPPDKEEKEKDKKSTFAQTLQSFVFQGNKLSKGQNIEGETQDQETSLIQQYGQIVVEKIRPYWKLPRKYLESPLNCKIMVKIARDGKLIDVKMIQGSGDEGFDNMAQNAIREAAPFPSPPAAAGFSIQKGRLLLAFPL